MRFVDVHIHLSDEEYSDCVDEIVGEAEGSGVVALVSNSVDIETSLGSLELASKFSGRVYAAIGIHPWAAKEIVGDEVEQMLDLISKRAQDKELVAVGEVGLDLKCMDAWDRQLKIFDSMLHAAEECDLPVIIHSRGTTEKIIDMLPSYSVKKVLLHWFSNPIGAVAKVVDRGYYVSEGAPSVFSKGIRDVIRKVPLNNLLTETDGPVRYFRKPFAGKRTTPAFIPTIVEAIAELKNVTTETVAENVAKNYEDLFEMKLKLQD